ncbi:WbuC family cupin fold metalloprotein [Marinobacter salarius]|jgi:cupin fold WbuC family metalloprotein|uniref:WbuC family cupin fold metalloprotein n=1 Tax=Marinobacter salarius TaxID=1420917 RepID=UPI003BA85465
MSFKVIAADFLNELASRAGQSPRKRQHHNIHDSFDDPCQKLLNAVGTDSYIRPHRHALDPKDECLFAAKGLFALVVFSDQGEASHVERFGTEKYFGENTVVSLGVELKAGTWHTVLALEPGSVLLELKAGPFDPDAAKEFAPWAPEEGTEEAENYLSWLKSLV